MKKVLYSMAFLMMVGAVSAQDKIVKKSRALLDESAVRVKAEDGTESTTIDLAKVAEANTMLQPALTSGQTKNMAAAWDLQGEIYQRLFTVELNKAVAKQDFDLDSFDKNYRACLEAYDKCFDVDEKQEFTQKNTNNMRAFRDYHAYLGQFFYQQKKFKEASEHFGRWLTFAQDHKMVANDQTILSNQSQNPIQIAYYAMSMAFQAKDYDRVLLFKDQALEYKDDGEMPYKLVLQAYYEKGDMDTWVKYSKECALRSSDESFAQKLLAYLLNNDKKDEAVAFADELLGANPDNVIANFLKGTVLMEDEKPMDALVYFEKVIEIDPDYADAYLQAGVCHTREGNRINNEINQKKTYKNKAENEADLEKVRVCYRKAKPYVEKFMEMKPDKPELWAYQMSNIYYVLGDKAKQAEMDALLPKE